MNVSRSLSCSGTSAAKSVDVRHLGKVAIGPGDMVLKQVVVAAVKLTPSARVYVEEEPRLGWYLPRPWLDDYWRTCAA